MGFEEEPGKRGRIDNRPLKSKGGAIAVQVSVTFNTWCIGTLHDCCQFTGSLANRLSHRKADGIAQRKSGVSKGVGYVLLCT